VSYKIPIKSKQRDGSSEANALHPRLFQAPSVDSSAMANYCTTNARVKGSAGALKAIALALAAVPSFLGGLL
jgi:hypothetical protein